MRCTGFKAQVVAPSRAAALRYSEHLNSLGLCAYPIITSTPQRRSRVQGSTRESTRSRLSTPSWIQTESRKMLVVVDMLLTGFDAPVEQTLYLDRFLRDHGLLQAIARVNRRFSHEWDGVATEKTHGLIVDYHGVSRNLEEALSTFDWPDVQDTMLELDEDPAQVIEASAFQAESHFKEPRSEQYLGVYRHLRTGCRHGRRLQSRRLRAVQCGLPLVLTPHGPLSTRPASTELRGPTGAAYRDPRLCPCPVPP